MSTDSEAQGYAADFTATALRILDAVALDDEDAEHARDRLTDVIQTPIPVIAKDGDTFVDASCIVVPAYLLASTIVSYAADHLGVSRAEVMYDIREIMQPVPF